MSDFDESMNDDANHDRLHVDLSLGCKVRRSITKVKRSLQRMTEDSTDEDEDDIMARRLLQIPRENLASLSCRTGFSSDEVRRLYRAFKQQAEKKIIERRQAKNTAGKGNKPFLRKLAGKRRYEDVSKIYSADPQCPNGVATTKDLTPAYAKLFPLGDSRKYAEIVFNSFDEDKDGLVSFGDLLTGLASIVKGDADQKLSWIFRLYDLNGDGCITRHEMMTGVSAIYEMVRSAQVIDCAVERHVNRLFEKMDLNRDGVISRDEFLDTCKNDAVIFNQLKMFNDLQY
ncbi:neuronal calcium sensor 1-like isoform X1 [Phymastichus coffea]|uniref:neuronal calcium sensor 1-like isoform X1 n=1 Tax=Phymastichus coffea TaxID=108790 RepID=UPI00273AFC36|nr:neuronal calcium sensor 1-like isoform X1 [Phymastichus coffea]